LPLISSGGMEFELVPDSFYLYVDDLRR